MIRPRIILARGIGPLARDAIVLDHAKYQIWHRGRALTGNSYTPAVTQFRVASILLMCAGGIVTWPELIDHVYGDREDGGSDNPRRQISVTLHHLRPIFFALGFSCFTHHGVGYRLEARSTAWNEWKAAA